MGRVSTTRTRTVRAPPAHPPPHSAVFGLAVEYVPQSSNTIFFPCGAALPIAPAMPEMDPVILLAFFAAQEGCSPCIAATDAPDEAVEVVGAKDEEVRSGALVGA